MTIFEQIKEWNKERLLLDKKYNHKAEYNMLDEELGEFILGHAMKSEHEMVDALADIIVIAAGSIYKLGYDTDKVMVEVLKEINSRSGVINENTGKWEKDISLEAQSKWHKADFRDCKL